uniref:G_PROTEIN_RECEP_F1_2 domain-containing protein n=1 Tax=Anisakis simplex TaxID=6269 RepID=A0A0M3KCG6_ANISI
LWWSYIGPLLALCHVSMTFSCFLIILATIERYLITQKAKCLQKFRQYRQALAMFMFTLALVVMRNGNCTGLTEFEPMLTSLVSTWLYGTIFRFYFRNILTVFVPFFLLAYLNVRIVATLRAQQRKAAMFKFACSEHKMKIRSATRLTVFIVCSYLMANVLNVLITAWEYVDFESAVTPDNFWIYETCTDVISVLYVFTCATRLLVYMLCNKEIRIAINQQMCCFTNYEHGKYRYIDERHQT